ncbi:hypothetical protein H7J07_05930 [Mycobacterium koreense]|nr:hypothetical protein [Mycolicibacillus koreensis]MCV7247765.1 hypothetical protein [Mycolicibacillus koreensis]BBY54148.1 hypothetical protein MKOR_13990 [Mycolicibacillus koreensis]
MATSYDVYACHECGEDFFIDTSGAACHLYADGERDYDADGDHIPYDLDD